MKPEEDTNFYRPDNDGGEGASLNSSKSSSRSKNSVSWTASEFIEHQRGASWYLLLILATAVLAVGVYFITKDYFATGVIVILGFIVAFSVGHKPRQVTYQLGNSEIKVGDKSYPYSSFKSFSVIRDGALSSVTFYPTKRLALPISAFFEPKDEEKIVNAIGDYLPLEDRKPDGIDRLSKRLKL